MMSVVLLTSCTKDFFGEEKYNNFEAYLTVPMGKGELPWLTFPTVEGYEHAVDYFVKEAGISDENEVLSTFEENMQYTSSRTFYSEKELDSLDIFDNVLSTLLNPDRKVQIANFVITIDMLCHDIHIQDAKKPLNIIKTSTENDLLDYIKGDISFEELDAALKKTKSTKLDDWKIRRQINYGNSIDYVTMEAHVSNAGIFKSLYSKISVDKIYLGKIGRFFIFV